MKVYLLSTVSGLMALGLFASPGSALAVSQFAGAFAGLSKDRLPVETVGYYGHGHSYRHRRSRHSYGYRRHYGYGGHRRSFGYGGYGSRYGYGRYRRSYGYGGYGGYRGSYGYGGYGGYSYCY